MQPNQPHFKEAFPTCTQPLCPHPQKCTSYKHKHMHVHTHHTHCNVKLIHCNIKLIQCCNVFPRGMHTATSLSQSLWHHTVTSLVQRHSQPTAKISCSAIRYTLLHANAAFQTSAVLLHFCTLVCSLLCMLNFACYDHVDCAQEFG